MNDLPQLAHMDGHRRTARDQYAARHRRPLLSRPFPTRRELAARQPGEAQ